MAEKKVVWGAIVPAAGIGERMNGIDKLFVEVDKKPALVTVIRKLQRAGIRNIYLGVRPNMSNEIIRCITSNGFEGRVWTIDGGATRQETVSNCIKKLHPEITHVLIHDAARPYVSTDLITKIQKETVEFGATCAAIPVVDTIHKADSEGILTETIQRENLWRAQTPQAFSRELLEMAHMHATGSATDDAMMVKSLGYAVKMVRGEESNIKITFPEDLRH